MGTGSVSVRKLSSVISFATYRCTFAHGSSSVISPLVTVKAERLSPYSCFSHSAVLRSRLCSRIYIATFCLLSMLPFHACNAVSMSACVIFCATGVDCGGCASSCSCRAVSSPAEAFSRLSSSVFSSSVK